jgi:acylglycerol lipase
VPPTESRLARPQPNVRPCGYATGSNELRPLAGHRFPMPGASPCRRESNSPRGTRRRLPSTSGASTEAEYYAAHGVEGESSYFSAPDGSGDGDRRVLYVHAGVAIARAGALVFMVHGYGNDISWTFQSTAVFLARSGLACFAADLPGHGLRAFVPDLLFFRAVRAREEHVGLSCFLFGESMGGAICLLVHLHTPPEECAGAALVAPMCRISDRIRPPWALPEILTAPIVPTADLIDKSVMVAA